MKNISVLGWYNHDNIGDEAYKLAFPKLFPNYNFTFSEDLADPETIVLGGGDVMNDTFLEKIKRFPHVKKHALSINVRNRDELSMFERIVARNLIEDVPCYPDFTFVLEGNKERGQALIKQLFQNYKADLYQNLVIIVMNSFLCTREHALARDYVNFDKVCFDLAKLIDSTAASFLFMPFGNGFPQNDRIAGSAVYAYCKFWKKNLLLFDRLGIQDYLDIFAAADATISTRLHGAIFSCIGGTPFIDITHHSKTKLFLELIGKPQWGIDYWHFEYKRTKELLENFLANKHDCRSEVMAIDAKFKKMLVGLSGVEL